MRVSVFIFIAFFAATPAHGSSGVRGAVPPALGDRNAQSLVQAGNLFHTCHSHSCSSWLFCRARASVHVSSKVYNFQGRVPYTNTKCGFYKGLSLESVADSLEFLIPSNDSLGHLNKNINGPCIYKVPGGLIFYIFLCIIIAWIFSSKQRSKCFALCFRE